MEYTLFYKKIKNPLDDRAIIEELVDAYSESSDFYSALTKRYSKNKTKYYDSIACDELHAALFNRWKRELFLITREQYEYAIKNKVLYDKDIYKLLNFLRTVPDVKTKKEADDILNKAFEDKELEEAMEKYRWDSLGAFSSWTHISERKINGYKTSTPKVEHRFYINAELRDVHKLSKIFMDKCYKYKLPFYFKIDEFGGRDDNIVIYSNTELLPNYFCILCEIEKEYPNIIKRCGKPTILSGVLRNWIGYGSEPIKLSGKSSFNSIRSKSIEKAIHEELIEWYKDNKDATIQLKSKTVSLTDYIARQVTKEKIKDMVERRRRYPNSKGIKYTEKEITSSEFVIRTYKLVNERMEKIFNNYLNGTSSYEKIEIPLNQDEHITIYGSQVISQLRKFVKTVRKNDSDFINRVKRRIVKDAVKNGIDPNKYCFDIENVELLRKAEISSKKQENQPKERIFVQSEAPKTYRKMTDEEILESRKKLFESQPVKVKK